MSHVHLHGLRPHRHLITSVHIWPPITAVRSHSFLIQTPKSSAPIRIRTPLIHHRNTVKCMANERRVKMVAKQLQRVLSEMLLTDKVLQEAVSPEAALGADRYLSSVTTISDVVLSPDLRVVKVYVSVFGDDRGREVALTGLKSKARYVRSQLGKRMRLRVTPEVRFMEDDTLERGSRVLEILDRIKAKKENAVKQADEISEPQGGEEQEDDDDPDDDEPDDDEEDIIYVK